MGTIAVTGSASGIGRACAARLTGEGHRVIGIDLHDAAVVADLATPDGRQAAVDGVLAASDGVLDGLVPCAGLGPTSDRPGALIISVNFFGAVRVLEGLRPALAAATQPAAVAICSNGTTITPGVPRNLVSACVDGDEAAATEMAARGDGIIAYAASKLALARWLRHHAVTPDWIGAGIRLNAIAPGMIETALIAEGRADPMMGPILELFPIPLGRPGTADEMAALVSFLLGPDSSFFCGSIVFADGGSDALVRPDDWPAPISWTGA